MAQLKDKVQNALDEGHILVLGAQVLLGFEYRSIFETGFEKLPYLSQQLRLGSLGLLLATLALLLLPPAYHRIAARGSDTPRLHAFVSRVMDWALLPFALGLGLDTFVVFAKVLGDGAGVAAGAGMSLLALAFWYGWEAFDRPRFAGEIQREQAVDKKRKQEPTELKDKIKHILTEARMVLPGAQALFGFQFAIMLMETFDRLDPNLKYIHLASLGMIGLTTVLLMAPAAYHRIVEQGEDTPRFHRIATRLVLAAMAFLPLGLAGDLYVVVARVLKSDTLAFAAALILLVVYYGLWFGVPLLLRRRESAQGT